MYGFLQTNLRDFKRFAALMQTALARNGGHESNG